MVAHGSSWLTQHAGGTRATEETHRRTKPVATSIHAVSPVSTGPWWGGIAWLGRSWDTLRTADVRWRRSSLALQRCVVRGPGVCDVGLTFGRYHMADIIYSYICGADIICGARRRRRRVCMATVWLQYGYGTVFFFKASLVNFILCIL